MLWNDLTRAPHWHTSASPKGYGIAEDDENRRSRDAEHHHRSQDEGEPEYKRDARTFSRGSRHSTLSNSAYHFHPCDMTRLTGATDGPRLRATPCHGERTERDTTRCHSMRACCRNTPVPSIHRPSTTHDPALQPRVYACDAPSVCPKSIAGIVRRSYFLLASS